MRVAVIVAVVGPDSPDVAMRNVALDAPGGTVTVVGVEAPVVELNAMIAPLGPAGPFSVTLPDAMLPPTIDTGETDTPVSAAGVTVRVADWEPPASVPVIDAFVTTETGLVTIGNVTDVAPAGTVADGGSVTAALAVPRVTKVPPVPAAPLRVRVPVEVSPPLTEEGETDRLDNVAGVIVKDPDCVLVP